MKMKVRVTRLLVALMAVAVAPVAVATDRGAESRDRSGFSTQTRRDLVVSATGTMLDDTAFQLKIQPGQIAINALRVYSEPSHTLLTVILDRDFSESDAGTTWQRNVLGEGLPGSMLLTQRASEPVTLFTVARPRSDQRVVVWLNGVLPDGTDGDRIVADGQVGPGDFSFSMYWETPVASDGGGPLAPGVGHPCCSNGPCGQHCTDCEGPAFTCCLLGWPDCCWIACGHNTNCLLCTCTWQGCYM